MAQRFKLAGGVGLIGATVAVASSMVAGAAYVGADGERYSPLNHWISELGDVSESELSGIFNLGLIVAGICLATFLAAVGRYADGRLGRLGALTGASAGLAGSLVGLYPMHNWSAHLAAAFAFFVLIGISIALEGLALRALVTTPIAKAVALLTIVAVIAFIGHTAASWVDDKLLVSPERRPSLLVEPTLEWLAFAGAILWVATIALSLVRVDRSRR